MEKLINEAKKHLIESPNDVEQLRVDLLNIIVTYEKLIYPKWQSWTIKYKEFRKLKIQTYFVKDAPSEIAARMNAISVLPRNIRIISSTRE